MADPKPKASTRRRARPAAAAPRGFTISTAWALAIVALLTVLFFHEVVVGGKTFVSPDATQPAGFVRAGESSLYHDHVYPLWNPYVFLGMPSFASGAYNPLIYPPDWPIGLLQKMLPLPELTWMLVYYVLAGWFAFLLAREWGARPEGALLGAVVFVFAPNLIAVGSHGHGSQLVDSAYLPLMVWLAARWLQRGGLSNLAWLALAGGFQLLRGHVQVCFYTWIAVVAWGVVAWLAVLRTPAELGPRTLRLAGLALAGALAFGLAGFYNLPLRDYARYSIRGGGEGGGVGMDYATQWSLAPYELPTMVAPSWAGFGGQLYWGSMPFTDYPNIYVGAVAILLLVPAFLANGAPRVYALALAVISILIAFGRNFPLYGFLYDHLPLFNKFRVPVMIVLLYQLAVALGAAWGWTAVLEGARADAGAKRRLDRVLLASGVVVAVALVGGVAAQGAWRAGYIALAVAKKSAPGNPYPAEAATMAYQAWVGDLGRAGLLGLLAVGLAWFAARGRLSAAVASAGVVLLAMIELWPISGRVMQPVIGDPVQRNLEIGRDDVVDFLEKAGPPGTFRVLPVDEIMSNRYAGFHVASIAGYHAAKPRLFQDVLDADLLWPTHGGAAGFNAAWMRLLNVRYLILPERLPTPPPAYREVFAGSRFVYEYLFALPRATVVGSYRVVRPAKAILDSVKNGAADGAGTTFLEEDPHLALGPVAGASARIATYGLNDVTIDVETPGPALLRLADLWYPDWVATVDGRPASLLRADYLLRAVPVPAGKHRVEMHFRSPALSRGLQASIGSLVVILLLFGLSWGMRRRRAAAAAPAAAGAD